jgi:hypothetical protein
LPLELDAVPLADVLLADAEPLVAEVVVPLLVVPLVAAVAVPDVLEEPVPVAAVPPVPVAVDPPLVLQPFAATIAAAPKAMNKFDDFIGSPRTSIS